MKQDKRIFERLIRMLDLIPVSPRRITARELHTKLIKDGFVVSKRTVERDLMQLSETFGIFNDDTNSPYGWSWDKDCPHLSLPGLTPDEALTFKLAEAHLAQIMPVSLLNNIKPYFSQADKVLQNPLLFRNYSKWLDKVKVVHPWQPLIAPEIDQSVLAKVHQATLDEKQLNLMYQSRNSDNAQLRIVNPLGIVIRGYISYLVCSIDPFTDIRLLAMHRISEAEVCSKPSVIPPNYSLNDYLETGALGYTLEEGKKIIVTLKFDKVAGLHLIESPLSENQTIIETDNHIKITANVMDTMQLRWWLLGFGSHVEVVAPSILRDEISAHIRSAFQTYE